MLKELQKNPLSREILHADFYEVSLTKEIDITVGLKIVERPPSGRRRIPPGNFPRIGSPLSADSYPDKIEVDVSTLGIGDSLHVQDLKLPEGFRSFRIPTYPGYRGSATC